MSESHHGSCLCGTVRFHIAAPLQGVVYCHCSQCRRQTGLYYATTDVDMSKITIEGNGNITWYAASDDAKRGFCATCGSALFWKRNNAERISVLAGAFEQPSDLVAESHIYVADKAGFYAISDDLPQFPKSASVVGIGVGGDEK